MKEYNAPVEPPAVEVWGRERMLGVLAVHDVPGIYRLLREGGLSQRRIAALTGQTPPEVSAVIGGRGVFGHDVLARIAYGLGIPPCLMGLGFGSCGGGCSVHPRSRDNEVRFLAQLAGVAAASAERMERQRRNIALFGVG
jgi:transcriptional regulator with XRE-family HTH domain